MNVKEIKLGIIGLGYVGLPLAAEFGKHRPVVAYDINQKRVDELSDGIDTTFELTSDELIQSSNLVFTSDINEIANLNCYIVTVPTPIDSNNVPDLEPLKSATESIARIISKGDIVIYESTVYPGATEEICVPILETNSNLQYNGDFFIGYSPERINPGDKQHRLNDIVKVTSGSTPEIAQLVDDLYRLVISAGTYKAKSIKVAEAAKVIENTQRDVNIALINELALIFNKLDIDTEEVLAAASTKWNFLPFKPGLVGGHCIGVDPYYLTYKAQSIGYNPEIILAGRALNDNMSNYVVSTLEENFIKKNIELKTSKILILGLTFKENCPDIRNTRIVEVFKKFKDFGCDVDIYDPSVSAVEVKKEYKINLIDSPKKGKYDGILIALAHDEFRGYSVTTLRNFAKKNHVLFDVKYIFEKKYVDGKL